MRNFLVGGAFVYSAVLAGLALFRVSGLEGPWWLALPNILLPSLFLPLPLLVLLAFRLRSRFVRFCGGFLVLLFALLYGGLFLPRASPASGGVSLRVMTLNHLYLNHDLEAIKGTILRQDADIVALQELTPEVAEMVRRELGARYPYRVLRPSLEATLTDGLGLLSRFPLVDARYNDAYRGQRVTVRVEGREVTFINLHLLVPFAGGGSAHPLAFDPRRRDRQLEHLEDAVAELEPVVVAGDFNLSDQEAGYRSLSRLMTDAYRHTRAGFGFTFPTGKALRGIPWIPFVRLDYIWVKGLTPIGAYRDCRGGSDHCAVVADVRLP